MEKTYFLEAIFAQVLTTGFSTNQKNETPSMSCEITLIRKIG